MFTLRAASVRPTSRSSVPEVLDVAEACPFGAHRAVGRPGQRPQQLVRNPAGAYQLFRVGDAVASRNIHAAVYDAMRLCVPL